MRFAVVSIVATLIVVGALPAHAVVGRSLPACRYEDGNTDGRPCTWFDPDTGDGYYVGSDDYRDTDRR